MLGRKSLLIFVTNLVGGVFGLVSLFFIGRYMNPTAFGMYGFAFSIVGLASLVAKMGLDSAHIKRVSEGRDLGDCITTYSVLKGGLVLLFTIGLAIASWVWAEAQGFHDATTLGVLLVVVLFGALAELRMMAKNTFDALLYTATSQVLLLTEHLVRTPLLIVTALLFGFLNGRWIPFSDVPQRIAGSLGISGPMPNSTGAALIAAAHAVAMAASLAVALYLFRRHAYPIGRYRPELAKDYVTFALPLALGSALYLVADRVDAFMIGYFWNADDVGWYMAAQRLTVLLLIIPIAVRTLFFPLMSELVAKREMVGLRQVALTAQRYMSLVVFGLTMLLIVWPTEIIHIILSDSFIPAAPVLVLLSVYTVLFSLSSVSSTANMGAGEAGLVTKIAVISALLNIALNLVLVPDSLFGVPLFGLRAPGAALGTVLAEAVRFLLHLWLARRLTGSLLLSAATFKHLAAAIGVGTLLHLLTDHPLLGGLDRWYELGAGLAFGGLLYLAVLFILRDITRKDLLVLVDMVHPMKMVRYVRDELGKKGRR